MEFLETIGIDISKQWFDARMHLAKQEKRFDNTQTGFKRMSLWIDKSLTVPKESILFAFEHTGLYSHGLAAYLSSQQLKFILIPALELHRSMGIVRGKEDRVDAAKIALYAYRRKDEITPYQMPAQILYQLRHLLSLRDRIVIQRAGYEASLKESKCFLTKTKDPLYFQTQERIIRYLNKQIDKIDSELCHTIQQDNRINTTYELITGIKGVGSQTAYFMIVYTHNFSLFSEWRKFASYAGTAPFPYQSGSSIHGKTKVNHMANKKVKTLLNLCAVSSI